MRRVLAVGSGIGIVAVAAVVWSWFAYDRPKRRVSVAAGQEESGPAAAPIESRPPHPRVEVAAVRPPVPEAVAPTAVKEVEESDSERVELDLRRAADVEAQFEMDAPPLAESWRLRTDIDGVFQKLAPRGVELETVDCRHRLCRVQLLFGNTAADVDILTDLFVRSSSPEISRFAAWVPTREYLPDSRVRTILYIAREGSFEIID